MKPLGHWLAETRVGRVVFRSAILGFGAVAAAALVWIEVSHQVDRHTQPIVQRIEIIERVEPVDLLRECLRTPECRRLFLHPEEIRPDIGSSHPAPAP